MPLPMPPTSSMFLLAEAREHPMHVGGMQLFQPPEGMTALDVREMFDAAIASDEVAPLLRKRPRRSITTLGQWAWEQDRDFDLEHHVRRSALPAPGRIRELLALVSRLHSTLLDRHRPLWEMHLIEGLEDGRFAVYSKIHHALVDGISSLRLLARMLSDDPDRRDMPPPWAVPLRPQSQRQHEQADALATLRAALGVAEDAAGAVPAVLRMMNRALHEQAAAMSFSAPRTMFNVPITGARRFAAQSWEIERLRRVGKSAGATVNDVVLAMSAGALRRYLRDHDALPEAPLIAMVPVSLHGEEGDGDGGGNKVGTIMCSLATDLADPADRLAAIHRSMADGKAAMAGMSQLQVMAGSALGMSPLALSYLPLVHDVMRPPFNLVISNVPGPSTPMFWNGARLDGLYPLSIPLDGQAMNITCTSYADQIGFGIVGCRRSVPHLQRLLTDLDDELVALEEAAGL